MRPLLIILLFATQICYGIIDNPILLRACINYNDSTITVKWDAILDACGSFEKVIVYGNENNGVYQEIATITDINVLEYPHYIPNLNTNRKYYLSLHSSCNGAGSFLSDTISPDLLYPAINELDSISFDINTQHIIAGWTKNTSLDTRGYQIYNYISGNGDSIGYTTQTRFTVSTDPTVVFPVVLAAIDSCNLTSTLSRPHRPIVLTGSLDTCANSIRLNWTNYQGWLTVDSQAVYVRFKNQSFKYFSSLSNLANTFLFTNFQLGDTFDILIRGYTKSGTISSSSNYLSYKTRKLEVPNLLYLSNVSVTDNEDILIDIYIDNPTDQKALQVYRSFDNQSYTFVASIPVSSQIDYSITDPNAAVNERSYNYQVKLLNKCDDSVAVSNESRSIFLSVQQNFTFNEYINWLNGVKEYHLETSKSGSTWNAVASSVDTAITIDSIHSGCYRIRAKQNTTFLFDKESYSNRVCKQDSMRIFVPTAINTQTKNNTFAILGTGIDHTKSNYSVYNRWGEKLVDNATNVVWDCHYNGSLIEQGVYIYIINAIGELGEKQTIKGTIYVIR